ncbi:hypothetical protein F8B43_3837 [Methylorubrum populi]|uniref:Uncharacterized protein n=1 Tax=Methylorubrum populi TaxID=223967 RepID=A0A833N2I6_9HYPH|nr:hypothetical protein F8B43_3837 [Methylorubrum populi]
MDGIRKGDERDNTFHKAMRRLRGKHLRCQGKFHSPLPDDAG